MRLAAFVALLICSSQAARVSMPNIGLSAEVPAGWVLSKTSDTTWQLEDTVLVPAGDTLVARHGGIIGFDAMSGAASVGASVWAKDDASAWRLFLETQPCYGWVYLYDSTLVDNKFAMYVQGEWSSCPDTSVQKINKDYYSVLVRTVAQGDVGWEISVITDTLDFLNYYDDYRSLLDSVVIDPAFQSLRVGVQGSAVRASSPFRIRSSGSEWAISATDGKELPNLRVLNADGRDVGRLERQKDSWIWHPGANAGFVWVVSGNRGGYRTMRIPVLQ